MLHFFLILIGLRRKKLNFLHTMKKAPVSIPVKLKVSITMSDLFSWYRQEKNPRKPQEVRVEEVPPPEVSAVMWKLMHGKKRNRLKPLDSTVISD